MFLDCSALTDISFEQPSSVEVLLEDCFDACSSLQTITIPSSLTRLGYGTFINCTSLTEVSFASDSSLKYIGKKAFQDCSNLQAITIPSSVTLIDGYAFNLCTALESITIPSSVAEISNNAFSNCTSLTDVSFSHTSADPISILPKAFLNISSTAIFNWCYTNLDITNYINDNSGGTQWTGYNTCS